MISSLLIANRGEIACRIIRTARAMGVRTVAVYSDADAGALHVRQADEAVHIGASPAAESYLRGDRIIAAALETGAEAIHPGYGFLSENADFAQAVTDAGLIWVGPHPDSIRAMGLKDAAKRLMQAAGVPTTPGYLGDDQNPDRLFAEAEAIGWPALIKAVAGGGGKGMRRVDEAGQFMAALDAARREAASSFGDDRVLLEKYVLSPRHIEVQVFGDSHGNIVHLFERDCSLQRRHQKVVEEAPAPGMDETTRQAVCAAAVQAARAVDYVGAGTVEFIADASEGLRADRIWFMEMNTRLQVEHPVTEAITGVDLVEWQLRVASGEPLPKRQDELAIDGYAIEARLYAEDPAKGFLPSVGRLDHVRLEELRAGGSRWLSPDDCSDPEFGGMIRVDTGVRQGATVSPFYDPMLAKLIAHESSRGKAVRSLTHGCAGVQVWPVRTNAGFLVRLLKRPEVLAGGVDTGFIARCAEALSRREPLRPGIVLAALRGLRAESIWFDPLATLVKRLAGFRLNAAPQEESVLFIDRQATRVRLAADGDAQVETHVANSISIGEEVVYFQDGEAYCVSVRPPTARGGGEAGGGGAIVAPMPGRITAVAVKIGQEVVAGQVLVTLEAMKMEQALVAPFDGTIGDLHAEAGGHVEEGRLLVRVEQATPTPLPAGDTDHPQDSRAAPPHG